MYIHLMTWCDDEILPVSCVPVPDGYALQREREREKREKSLFAEYIQMKPTIYNIY